jgi:hypothetical protein
MTEPAVQTVAAVSKVVIADRVHPQWSIMATYVTSRGAVWPL